MQQQKKEKKSLPWCESMCVLPKPPPLGVRSKKKKKYKRFLTQ